MREGESMDRRDGDDSWGRFLDNLRREQANQDARREADLFGSTSWSGEDLQKLFASMGDHPEEDMVNSPSHYTGDVECIDGLEAALGEEGFQGYCRGNAMKYLWRCENKGKKLEDLQKAKWYLDKLIERMEDE